MLLLLFLLFFTFPYLVVLFFVFHTFLFYFTMKILLQSFYLSWTFKTFWRSYFFIRFLCLFLLCFYHFINVCTVSVFILQTIILHTRKCKLLDFLYVFKDLIIFYRSNYFINHFWDSLFIFRTTFGRELRF